MSVAIRAISVALLTIAELKDVLRLLMFSFSVKKSLDYQEYYY